MKVYGQTDPPEYKVEDVNVPIATYWGENDYLASKEVGIVGSGYAYSSFQISTYYFTQKYLEFTKFHSEDRRQIFPCFRTISGC